MAQDHAHIKYITCLVAQNHCPTVFNIFLFGSVAEFPRNLATESPSARGDAMIEFPGNSLKASQTQIPGFPTKTYSQYLGFR